MLVPPVAACLERHHRCRRRSRISRSGKLAWADLRRRLCSQLRLPHI